MYTLMVHYLIKCQGWKQRTSSARSISEAMGCKKCGSGVLVTQAEDKTRNGHVAVSVVAGAAYVIVGDFACMGARTRKSKNTNIKPEDPRDKKINERTNNENTSMESSTEQRQKQKQEHQKTITNKKHNKNNIENAGRTEKRKLATIHSTKKKQIEK